MRILFERDADYDVYKRDYYPLLLKHGFTWQLFPELTIYLDMKYPGWILAQNADKEHYRPDIPAIFVRMITLDEWVAAGGLPADYPRMSKAYPSSLPHEIMHHIHYRYFGEDGSLIWQKAAALTGIALDFTPRTSGDYWWKPAYESIANYFEDCIEGRKENEQFMEFIRGLVYRKHVRIPREEYIIIDSRAYLPVRKVGERLGMVVEYSEDTRDVWVVELL